MNIDIRRLWCTAAAIGMTLSGLAQASGYPEVSLILDASGSMWGEAGGQTKIEAAKQVMEEVVPGLAPEVRTGLIAYGHRRKGDCSDIEVLVETGSDDRDALLAKVRALQPTGKTPLSDAVASAVEQLKTREAETTILLVSDGLETCAADPCKVVGELKATGIRFKLHVVGFGVDAKATEQLTCMAQAGGGRYRAAGDAAGLLNALNDIGEQVQQKVEVEKARSERSKAGTGLAKLQLTQPASAGKGMAGLRIVRVKDGKQVKATKGLGADSTHPLLPGEYEIEYLFKTPNYGQPTVTRLGKVTLSGGQTRELALGAVVFNIADPLKKASVDRVLLVDSGSGETVVAVNGNNNGYYNFVPKALLPGRYDLMLHYANGPAPALAAADILVKPGQETVVTLDAGLQFKEVTSTAISGWELLPADSGATADADEDGNAGPADQLLLRARPPSGNQSTLWTPYIVPPGSYRVMVNVEGMDEALPVADSLEIGAGRLVEFDSGL